MTLGGTAVVNAGCEPGLQGVREEGDVKKQRRHCGQQRIRGNGERRERSGN